MLPRSRGQAVVAGQGVTQDAHIGRTLDVIVAAEDVGAAAGNAHVAERELKHAVRARVVVADVVLGTAHHPDVGAGTVLGHNFGGFLDIRLRYAGHLLDLIGGPVGDLFADLVHTPDTLADKLLVLPAILEDMPEHAPDDGHVGARTYAHVMIGVGRGAREAWIEHDQLGPAIFGIEDMLQRNGVRLGGIATADQDRLGVADVVHGVGHRTITPCVRHTGNRGRMADTRLVVPVIAAPHCVELAEQIGLFVAVFRRAQPVHRVRPRLLADLQHLVTNLVDGLIPRDALPLAVLELGGVLKPTLTMTHFPQCRALAAVRTQTNGVVKRGLLTGPYTVLNLGVDTAAHRAMGTDGFNCLCLYSRHGRVDLFGQRPSHHQRRERRGHHGTAEC